MVLKTFVYVSLKVSLKVSSEALSKVSSMVHQGMPKGFLRPSIPDADEANLSNCSYKKSPPVSSFFQKIKNA